MEVAQVNEIYTDLPIKGMTFVDVKRDVLSLRGGWRESEAICFLLEDGREFCLFHEPECCETVRIEDIVGELSDLVGHPLEVAEEATSGKQDHEDGTETWTFYRFRTVLGSVTVRWHGTSNGYYSENVDWGCAEGEDRKVTALNA